MRSWMNHGQRDPRFHLWRAWARTCHGLKRRIGYAAISGGIDCDGMHWGSCGWHWTITQASAALDSGQEWADGPWGGKVYSALEGREWEANYQPDTRDRFAERAGY